MSIECTKVCEECPKYTETRDGCCEQDKCILTSDEDYREILQNDKT